MSYDYVIEMDAGGPEPIRVEGRNYTYNVSAMFYDACERAGGEWLGSSGTANCGEIAPILEAAAKLIAEDAERYEPMNPPNGWGNRIDAAEYLGGMAQMCRLYPKATIVMY